MSGRARLCQPVVGTAAWFLFLTTLAVCGQGLDQHSVAERVLTNILDIWAVPQEHRAEPHRIRTEVVISYFDPEWNDYWGECQGRGTWLPFYGTPYRLKPGQRIALDGIVEPARELFVWDKTQVQILGEGIELKPLPVSNVSRNLQEARNRFVAVEGLITRQTEDLRHIKLGFLSDGISATVYVLKDTNAPPPRFQAGDLVGMKCIFAPQFNKDGSLGELVLYVARPADITLTGTAKTEPRVSVAVSPDKPAREYALTNIADRVLTNLSEIWSVPPEHRAEPHRIRTEVVVYYFDSDWNAFWGECNGTPAWLPMLDSPFPLKTGQRVAIDGPFMQTQDRFIWDKTRVQILEEGISLKPVPVRNLNHNPQELQRHLVSVEGLIDRWTEEPTHVTIGFVSDGIAATVKVEGDTIDLTVQSALHALPSPWTELREIIVKFTGLSRTHYRLRVNGQESMQTRNALEAGLKVTI